MLTKHNFLILLSFQVLCVLASVSSNNTDIPNCSEQDENINECLTKAFQQMTPRARNGVPELSIPPMDPFVVNKTNFAFSASILKGKLGLRNLTFHGLADTITKSVTFKRNGNKATLSVKALIPKLFVEGNFLAKIQVNAAKISSKGPFNITMTDINLTAEPEAELYERDGHLYMRLLKFEFITTLGNLMFYGEGIMPDPLLNEAVIDFINQNWKYIYQNLITETRAAWEPEIVKLVNIYFSHVPIDAVLRP